MDERVDVGVTDDVRVDVCVTVDERVDDGVGTAVPLAVDVADGANVGIAYDCTLPPVSVCTPIGEPNAFSSVNVAPAICAPSDAPLALGDVSGKRLNSTTRDTL